MSRFFVLFATRMMVQKFILRVKAKEWRTFLDILLGSQKKEGDFLCIKFTKRFSNNSSFSLLHLFLKSI